MGRRKIDIEPIIEDRNRSVTFIKRKAGLLKKAYELSVLCQVDVSLIILGTNKTIYEFKSMDNVSDFLQFYQENDNQLNHTIKTPMDYGGHYKNTHVYDAIRNNKSTIFNKKPRKPYTRKVKHEESKDESKILHPDYEEEMDEDEEEEEDIYHKEEVDHSDDDDNDDDGDEDDDEGSLASQDDSTNLTGIMRTRRNTRLSSRLNSRNEEEVNTKKTHSLDLDDIDNIKLSKKTKLSEMQSQFKSLYHSVTNQPAFVGSPELSMALPVDSDNENLSATSKSTRTPSVNDNSINQLNASNTRLNDINIRTGKASTRPILRVRIPNDNDNNAHNTRSESVNSAGSLHNVRPLSSTSSNSSIRNSHFDSHQNQQGTPYGNDDDVTLKNNNATPLPAVTAADPLRLDKSDTSKSSFKSPTTSGDGLPPVYSSFPSAQPYIATPLQSFTNTSNKFSNANGSAGGAQINGLPPNSYNYFFQRQLQMSQQQQSNTLNVPNVLSKAQSPTLQDHGSEPLTGPPTGSLPSKFAHDLIFPSPNTSMSMFQDWSIKQEYSPSTSVSNEKGNINGNTNINTNANVNINDNAETSPSSEMNLTSFSGNTGLTPFITPNQPSSATGRYFNFSNEPSNNYKNNALKGEENARIHKK